MINNNLTRLLENHKIPFTAFDLPAEKLSAQETAEFLNVSLELIYKSIVVLRERIGKPVLAIVPGNCEVNLKAVAACVGEKKVRLASQCEAEQLSGLQVGGISPLEVINRGFLILLDQSAESHPQIHISGGQRGLNILLPVSALVELTHARIAAISIPAKLDFV